MTGCLPLLLSEPFGPQSCHQLLILFPHQSEYCFGDFHLFAGDATKVRVGNAQKFITFRFDPSSFGWIGMVSQKLPYGALLRGQLL